MGDRTYISKLLSAGYRVLLRLLGTPRALVRRLPHGTSPSFRITALPTEEIQQARGRTITAHSLGAVNLKGYGGLLSELRACTAPPDGQHLRHLSERWKHVGHFDLGRYAREFAASVPAGATFAHVCVSQERDTVAVLLLSNCPR